MKRRAAIEPIIGHMKSGHRLERNRLKGTLGNAINALLSAAAMNFGKLLKWVGRFWTFFSSLLRMIFLVGAALVAAWTVLFQHRQIRRTPLSLFERIFVELFVKTAYGSGTEDNVGQPSAVGLKMLGVPVEL
jgi:hypothetical protein